MWKLLFEIINYLNDNQKIDKNFRNEHFSQVFSKEDPSMNDFQRTIEVHIIF
jgi:hypothetical protein